MRENPRLDLYIKKVLREVVRSDDDAYIDTVIKKEVLARVAGLTGGESSDTALRAALRELGPASRLGKRYKKEYAFSAHRISGLMLFNRFFVNISASLLILIAAFAVFRMYPQKEYTAYLLCAIAGVAAGFTAHLHFYKASFMVTTAVLPSFLLVYYPLKAALAAHRDYGAPLFKTFFSYDNHIVFMIILSSVLFFALTALFLHARAYLKRPEKLYLQAVCVFTALAVVSGFFVYASGLRESFNSRAASLQSGINAAYAEYLELGVMPDTLFSLAQEARELAARYGAIYVPPNELTAGSLSELTDMLYIYDSGYENLVARFHASYDPEKEPPFDEAALDVIMDGAREETGAILSFNTGEPGLETLLDALARCDTLRFEIISSMNVLFENWAYAKTAS